MKLQTVKKRSQKQEKDVAKKLNARVVVASGALWGAKGDVRGKNCLVECKTTKQSFYPVSSKVWEKIEEEALKDNMRIPLLVVDIMDKDRIIVFDAKYFDSPPSTLVEDNLKENKSFRVSLLPLEIYSDTFIPFLIKGNKSHLLYYTKYNDFINLYGEEIFEESEDN